MLIISLSLGATRVFEYREMSNDWQPVCYTYIYIIFCICICNCVCNGVI